MAPLEFLLIGYLTTVAIETPILWFGLHPRHDAKTRLFAGAWLTACTYPIVILVLPPLTGSYYTPIAETFAPLAEILAFQSLNCVTHDFSLSPSQIRDAAAILAANLASFALGTLLFP